MQVRLVAPNVSTVVFPLSLHPLPSNVGIPQNWDAQLQRLASEDLDVPRSVYALDKSAWLTAILEDVTFDMESMTVSVAFSDGHVEEWPLMNRGCVKMLDGILADIQRLADQPRKEKTQEGPVSPPSTPTSPTSKKPVKHKKSRSFLARMASLMSSNAQSPAPPTPVEEVQPPPVQEPEVDYVRLPKPLREAIRLRARSALLDAYRRFIVSELNARLPAAGYSVWIAESMLRRALEHMDYLVKQAGGVPPDPRQIPSSIQDNRIFHSAQASYTPSPFFDEEEGDWRSLTDTISTDTDGSSLHTPLNTPVCTQVFRGDDSRPRSVAVPGYTLQDLETYAFLGRQALELKQSLVRVEVAYRNTVMEDRQCLAVLEIRSKRRAWSNRQFKGGASVADVGFATPTRPSPLGRHEPFTRDTLSSASFLLTRTVEYDVACLFPVTEEREEEDTEAGLFFSATLAEESVNIPLERPQIRVRTHSMHRLQGLDLDPMFSPDPPVLIVPPTSASTSLPVRKQHPGLDIDPLLSPDPPVLIVPPAPLPVHKHHGPTFVAPLPKPSPLFDHDVGVDAMTEFTLAMDVPYSVQEFGGKGTYEHDDWLPGVVVDCR
ncbi:hypothetical protein BV25DRAFT_997906 [Artomyces pyxidatus]|uniref:Uncharacterized protein n=1 Tax=Artomyces pyxidatus TaxID=48021 RepID=A0ACB8SUQ7_9AGAM|nr:hypothetical protein BV25DRAFT_997906 [Artomyces pyxidatus]